MLLVIDDDNKIVGWYDPDLSLNIPLDTIVIDDIDHQYAVSIFATHYIDGEFQNNNDTYINDSNIDLKQVELNKAKAYLRDTDWVKSYELEHKLGISLIPDDSSKWDIINKRQDCIDMINSIDSL